MSEKTYLNNAEIEKRDDCVIVTTQTGGAPSSPEPVRKIVRPPDDILPLGARVEKLYRRLIAEHLDENGE